MAAPTVRGVGVAASAAAATLTVALPTGFTFAAGDLNIVLTESNGNNALTPPAGWAHVTSSPVNVDTTTRLQVMSRFWQSGDGSAAFTGSTNHAVGRMITIGGANTTTPVNASSPATETVADTSATWNAVTTTVAECLMLFCIATGRDLNDTATLGALTGGTGLTNIVERMDNWVNAGAGGGIGLVTAEKATAGSTGTPGATMATTDAKALLTLAIAPAPAPPAVPPLAVVTPAYPVYRERQGWRQWPT